MLTFLGYRRIKVQSSIENMQGRGSGDPFHRDCAVANEYLAYKDRWRRLKGRPGTPLPREPVEVVGQPGLKPDVDHLTISFFTT